MQRIIILMLIVLLLPEISQAQKWKRQRVEYSLGFGATNFLGDLGGRDQVGSNFVQDFELKATRYAASLGYRYQLGKDWYLKGNLIYAKVSGADNLTEQPARARRQLNFKSNIVELSAQLEYMLIKQKTGHLYRLRGVRGKSWFRFEVYLLAGIGAIWYDPQGDKDGEWHRLAPLNTEGQGLPDGPSDYSGFTAVVPYGIGIRRNLSGGARSRHFGSWSISLELTMRKTFSDYIDDVSTVYYNDGGSASITEAYGENAGYFHDPSGHYANGGYGEAQQRGDDSDKDAYMLGIISINYKPARKRRNLPKF
ncbi:MAG: hypothetical protein COB15_01080 [Flavobacteriales bacterium]|nr:MAG: hypothetical protein COB15_01080 [Flavobacteriales bacterium]